MRLTIRQPTEDEQGDPDKQHRQKTGCSESTQQKTPQREPIPRIQQPGVEFLLVGQQTVANPQTAYALTATNFRTNGILGSSWGQMGGVGSFMFVLSQKPSRPQVADGE